ncbi:MAG: M23 family metallopeptidase [Myxococcales bacterium]|nr:M23 family metallopeptidase [Myxococcales bacterium]
MEQGRLRFFGEVLGLSPLPERLRQARIALAGEVDVPPSRFGPTSLSQLRPRIGPWLWAGRFVIPRTALVTNLYNHTPTPIEAGWSVEKTQVRDFRGRRLTYDSHNGTDFSVPVGTPVAAAAPGRVVRIASEYNRGGLKLFLDHGGGLMTCTAHLARTLVRVGDRVERGQTVALSGYSGLDALVTFPWGTPHIHFNVWLDGVPVDPFPHAGEVSMWRDGDVPLPSDPTTEPYAPSPIDPDRLEAGIEACSTVASRERIRAIVAMDERAAGLVAEMCYYPTRFREPVSPFAVRGVREPVLTLPLAREAVDRVVFVDDL